mgnify:CR=1 FL=1
MPRESGPQGGISQINKEKPADNSLVVLTYEASHYPVEYPVIFEPLSPEAKSIIASVQDYQTAFLGGSSLSTDMIGGLSQQTTISPNPENIQKAKENLWQNLQKIDSGLSAQQFSDTEFYHAVALFLPKYLAKFGILARPNFVAHTLNSSDNFNISELAVGLFQIEKMEQNYTEQWGKKLLRHILYLQGPAIVDGKPVNDDNGLPLAFALFGKVFLYEKKIQNDFDASINTIARLKLEIAEHEPGAVQILERNLGESSSSEEQWSKSVEIATVKIIKKIKKDPEYKDHKEYYIAHETGHLVDNMVFDIEKALPTKITSSKSEHEVDEENRRIHNEIDAIISALRYAPHRGLSLLDFVSSLKPEAILQNGPIYPKAKRWIMDQMAIIISGDPNLYGIQLKDKSRTSVGKEPQIISQLDVFLDQPQIFEDLCTKIRNLHINLLTSPNNRDDKNNFPEQEPASILHRIGKPAAVAAITGVALVLEALRRRKRDVAKEEFERRKNERKQNKSKK